MERNLESGLRRKAEVTRKAPPERQGLENVPTQVKKLIHELDVHQIELELENEELRRDREKREEHRLKYFDLFELAPGGYLAIDDSGIIREANPAATRLLGAGRTELIGRMFAEWMDENHRDAWSEFLHAVRENSLSQSCQLKLHQENDDRGGAEYVQLEAVRDAAETELVHINLLDITRQKKAEIAQRESGEKRFRALVEASSEVLYRMSADWSEMLQLSSRGFLANTEKPNRNWLRDYIPPDEQGRVIATIDKAISNEGVFELEHRVVRLDGGIGWTFSRAVPIFDEDGGIVEWFGAASDVTEHKAAEEALRTSEKRFRLLVEASSEVLYRMNPDWSEMRQFSRRGLVADIEKPSRDWLQEYIYPDDRPRVMEVVKEAIQNKSVYELEHRVLRPEGVTAWTSSRAVPLLDANGEIIEWVGAASDITRRKESEEKLRNALIERETLLKEVHHRVKNNLAVITSLLNLQMKKTLEEGARTSLKECQNRIRSMALIHESLYQAGDFSRLLLRDYAQSLTEALMSVYPVSVNRVRLKLDIDEDISLPIECTTPCGVVLNEIISNSLKYAFPLNSRGEISIKGTKLEGDEGIELIVGDNGVGIPEEIDIHKTGALGLHLVAILVERQLHGSLEVRREHGTSFIIRFDPWRLRGA